MTRVQKLPVAPGAWSEKMSNLSAETQSGAEGAVTTPEGAEPPEVENPGESDLRDAGGRQVCPEVPGRAGV